MNLRLFSPFVLLSLLVLHLVSCTGGDGERFEDQSSSDRKEPLFKKRLAEETNVSFENSLKAETEALFIKEYRYMFNGGGVSVGDINNDGLTDIFFTGNEVGNRLYLNLGDFVFEDVTEKAGISEVSGWFTGATMADVNADGYLDIYVSRSFNTDVKLRSNVLFINQKDGTFKNEAEKYGLDDKGFSTQAAFFDYNLDGLLDVYVLNHPDRWFMQLPINYPNDSRTFANQDNLYKNLGNGRFENVSKEAGLVGEYFGGYGLGVSISDIDNDNDPDIYVANDYEGPDFLYVNNGDGTFTESLKSRTGHTSLNSMGCDIADYNNDGYPDICVLDMAAEGNLRSKTQMRSMRPEKFEHLIGMGLPHQYMYNSLQTNQGDGTFSELAMLMGMAKTDWSWGPLFADFDLDGYKDLFITNGFRVDDMDNDYWIAAQKKYGQVLMQPKTMDLSLQMLKEMKSTPLRNYLYKNNNAEDFQDKTAEWGLNDLSFSQGAAYADLDNDGDFDLVVNNLNAQAQIYENSSAVNGSSISVRLRGPENNPFGIGTKVTLEAGSFAQYQEVYLTRGFQSSVEPSVLFVLPNDGQKAFLHVEWPDGLVESIATETAKSGYILDYSNASVPEVEDNLKKVVKQLSPEVIGVSFKHVENVFDDYDTELLLPYKHSRLGPKLAVGDVNNDGLEDFFVGGASGQMGEVFIQAKNGKFRARAQSWIDDRLCEDMGAAFFDADGDNDLDLYVVSGGNEYRNAKDYLQDRLYFNDGRGNFKKSTDVLPALTISGGMVLPSDFDGDGDVDLLVGGRLVPGQYPYPVSSTLLINHEGEFLDQTHDVAPELQNIGLVTGGVWSDIDGDSDEDLIIVGEWMNIKIFINQEGRLKLSDIDELDGQVGWWSSIEAADFDKDGDIDFVVGNLGLNYKYHATPEAPFHVHAKDFDGNGTDDIVLGYVQSGLEYPLRGKECSSQQMPFINRKFPTYQQFGQASIHEVYGTALESSLHYEATNFASVYIENKGNLSFEMRSLPLMAQQSTVNGIVAKDLNGDNNLDIVLAGNLYMAEIETPRNDASHGVVLLGDGSGNFEVVPKLLSGLDARGDVKDLVWMDRAGKNPLLFIARNNDSLLVSEIVQ